MARLLRNKMKSFFKRYTPLQIAMHVYAWSALIHIAFDLLTGNFSPNPIQELEQRTGRHAITLLVLSLACTPSAGVSLSNDDARLACMRLCMQASTC